VREKKTEENSPEKFMKKHSHL